MSLMTVAQGQFELRRFPWRDDEALQAWDAADEYLLRAIAEQGIELAGRTVLVLNDQFGALSLPLLAASALVVVQSDSWLAHAGISANLRAQALDASSLRLLSPLQPPECVPDLVLMRIPKSHAMLEYQLHALRGCLGVTTPLLAAAMAKHVHSAGLGLFEQIIGKTTTSLAWKKARLVRAALDPQRHPGPNPWPKLLRFEGFAQPVLNHANVFSRDKLDIGTRFLLQHLPQAEHYRQVVDLGCGNGLLGIRAAQLNPQAQVTFVDESFMAIASAQANVATLLGAEARVGFQVSDCLDGVESQSVDLVLNNPPFHQQHAVGDAVAWQMFRQSLQVLRPGGELWVVGNRHLGYHVKLKRLFGHCETVASNSKFVILKASRKA